MIQLSGNALALTKLVAPQQLTGRGTCRHVGLEKKHLGV